MRSISADDETGPVELEVVADGAVAGGAVIARPADGPVILVDGGLPGERLRVRVDRRRRRSWEARVIQVIEPSARRVAPPCPNVARGCGGCDLQHADVEEQQAMKRHIVVDALHRLGRIDAADQLVTAGPPLPAAAFRTTVRGGVDPSGRFAFRHRRRHDLVEPEHCLVAHPALDELLADGRFGAAGEVTLRVSGATGERLAVVDPRADDVVVPDDVLVVGLDELRAGRRAWLHEIVHGRRFRISARSFFQTRADGAAALVDVVRAAAFDPPPADLGPHDAVVDAYCGVGLFGAFLADGGRPLVAVERNRSSVADARHNLGLVGRDGPDQPALHATIVSVDVERWRPSPAGLVVADPSRAGLGRAAARRLAATGARRLVLVSCDPAALGRDADLLHQAGFGLEQATVVDLFPHTHHVEVVSRFDRMADDD
jgi:23S rRNA (uracil1939-C5)-methyltransferase